MTIAKRLAPHLQRLAEQRLSLVELALGLQLHSERVHGEACVLAIRALGLEPGTQEHDAQRVAVLVLALAAAVGCVLLRARAPPVLEAVFVGPHGGAAAGAWLHERAVAFALQEQPASPLVLLLAGALALGAGARRHAGRGSATPTRRVCQVFRRHAASGTFARTWLRLFHVNLALRSVTARRSFNSLSMFIESNSLSSGSAAAKSPFFLQELAEVVDGGERVRMPIAEGLTHPLQRLA
eukprot:scaffold83733_cov59-Phaeocystis_antarctica.AAC.5